MLSANTMIQQMMMHLEEIPCLALLYYCQSCREESCKKIHIHLHHRCHRIEPELVHKTFEQFAACCSSHRL